MTIEDKYLSVLEYDKVIARLARLCQTVQGRTLAERLKPETEHREVVRLQVQTAEARKLLEMKPNFSVGGVRDIGEQVNQARLGHTLEPSELLDVAGTLAAGRTARDMIERLRPFVPHLAEIADGIADFRAIEDQIARSVGNRGEILDSASPVLAQLRREARVAHDRLQAKMQQLLNANRSSVQEPIITQRDGRYVIPVKAELRAQLPGIVHDVSSSGQTVFLEPLEAVELGNRWRELLADEQREIARILRQLSQAIGSRAGEIAAAIAALAAIDLLVAKARLGEAMKCKYLPHDGPDQPWLLPAPGPLYLHDGRHPLLAGEVVPVTVWLGEQPAGQRMPPPQAERKTFRILLITGPNTGGKTVALKTVGLLALMAQAGLPVPAGEDTRLPVFDRVFADIGDEQSIEQSLSTFSSHVGNIVKILQSATERSLVLLDELAAGTDPAEGSALARAILGRLLQIGCLAIATTHHGELKAYAHVTPGVANASVEFNAETLSPTYRLHIGLPGQSNALAIARRLGMPPEVLAEAEAGIDPDRMAVESLLTDLHREREAAIEASATQQAAAREAEKARERVTRELQSLQSNRERLVERTRLEMETELQQARARIRGALKDLERAERLGGFERARAVEEAQAQVEAVAEAVKRVERRKPRRRRGPLPPINPGDRIYLQDVPTPGEALTEPDETGELEVTLGSLRARVNLKQIERVEKPAGAGQGVREYRPPVEPAQAAAAPELDLRGLTVDEALLLIDQRLDEASRAGVPELRIIHGKGTGTLRRAVREMLRRHALVRGHAAAESRDGGDGVTVVEVAV